jgi:WD40 repeat protein/serine/threonine protein kinase
MGTVYMAEQTTPVRRTVALKLIKAGMDSRQVLARFGAERQALALMDHPNIAKVFDAGTTDSGRPYFVMELVKGIPITRFCDERRLTTRQRLELAIPVCQAVQHAHQKGIIHRDLKPSNVLVALYDGKPVPKVIDFGVAKATGPRLTDQTLYTEFGAVVGTLEYMSPEQAELNQLDIDTRSDIYSLGVLLYELLTGSTPLDRKRLKQGAILEMLRVIREEESPRPSLRLSTTEELPSIAASRNIEPRKLSGLVRGELDWIVMKALEKDRTRRYETANGLAADLLRYLDDEPVQACPPSAWYRLSKFARRNKIALIAAGLIGVAMLAGVGTLAVSNVLITREKDQKESALLKAKDSAKEANDQRSFAVANEKTASERAENLRRQDYVNRINIALREVQDDNVPLAEELLQGCPVDLRGWEWHYVNRLAHLERLTYLGHREYLATSRYGQSIECLAISPDGSWIASAAGHTFGTAKATDGAEIRIWDPVTGRERRSLGRLPGTVQSLAISPDGSRIAAGGGYYEPKVEGWLTVWEVATGQPLWTRTESAATVMSVAFSPDGKSLAAGCGRYSRLDTGHVRLWEVATGTALAERFAQVGGGVNSLCFHPDGRRVALAGFGHVEIWDIATRARVRDLPGDTKWVYCVAFSPDGTRLATGGFDNTVKLWDPATGAEIRTLYGHKGFVRGVAFSPNGTLLASVSEGKDVRLWEVATGRELATFHGHSSFAFAVSFHPDGRRIASGAADGMVKIWDVRRSRPVVFRGHTGHVTHVAFRRDGRRVASEIGDQLQSRSGDEAFKVWDPATGEEDASPAGAGKIADLGTDFGPGGKQYDGWPDRGIAKVTSPDGRRIAFVALEEPVVHVKDAATNRVLITLRGHTGPIWCITFSPDGRRIATAGHDLTIKIWDANDGREVLTLRGHTHVVNCIAFSPNGLLLASGGVDTTVRVWDATPFSSDDLYKQEAGRVVFPNNQWYPQFKDELMERLRVDPTLSAPVRAAALAFVEPLTDDPEPLDDLSWRFVRAPEGLRADYLRALCRAEAAVRLAPENSTYLKTLGVALYRVGRYEQALEALRRATALDAAKNGGPTPAVLAFLAMAHWQLGDKPQARSWYDKTVQWMDKNQPKDEELIGFRAEAAAMLGLEQKTE